MKSRKIRLFVAGCVLFLIGSAWLLFFDHKMYSKSEIYVFPDSGIYRGSIVIEISVSSEKETVYYTIDGKKPSENGSNVSEYTEPILLYADPEKSAYRLLLFSRLRDGTFVEREERDYLILDEDRYLETDYVVCVQGDEKEIFGYE